MVNAILGLFGLGGSEVLIVVLAIVLLFGGRKIPELMRGIGKGVRSFREGLNDATSEVDSSNDKNKE